MTTSRTHRLAGAVLVAAFVVVGCGGSDSSGDESSPADAESTPDVTPPPFVLEVRKAIAAVEAELGAPQEFFEVTANPLVTNVFVALDDGTAAVAYAYVDDELQAPAPRQDGASGETFTSEQVDLVEHRILSQVSPELPKSTIDAISVYGNAAGVTYVLAATSEVGGGLDIVVGPDGAIFSVDPV